MKDNTPLPMNENSIWYKIKNFFKNVFGPKKQSIISKIHNETIEDPIKQDFINSLKQDEEKNIIKLVKEQYESGELELEDISIEDLKTISSMYDAQIDSLIKDITETKRKILTYSNV